jgi:hypothetical protein
VTATAIERLTPYAGIVPTKGTLPIAADTLILAGTIVCVNGDGRAVPGVDGEGFAAVGKAVSTVDNRTEAPSGGAAGAEDIEIDFGVHGWAFTGTTPEPGQVVFVVDNQTVSVDSDSGQRGIAGYVSEVVGSTCYVQMGPTTAGQIVIASAEAADLDQAQIDIDAVEARLDDLETDALSVQHMIPIPLSSWRVASDGSAIPGFTDTTTDGYSLVNSEALGIRINDDTLAAWATSVVLPPDLDDAEDITFHVLGFRVGAADTTVVMTVGAFFQTVGAAHNASSDAGGNTTAFDAATNVVSEETLTILAAAVPAAPAVMTLTMVPSVALDDDDLVVLGTWIECTRKLRTS